MHQRHHAAERREAVMHGIDRAVRGGGGGHRPQARIGDAEADLLAFHVGGIEPERGEVADCRSLPPSRRQRRPAKKDDRHGGIERPALPLVLDHAAEGVGERRRDEQDVDHLQEIAERRRVLVRDRGVGVPEAAAIGAELLDGDLRGGRPLADGLLGAFKRGRIDIGAEVLRHALPDENKRGDDGKRQQHVEGAAREVDPEIADGLCRGAREGADQRDGKRDAGGGRDEILGGEAHHLRQIAERAFAAVVLPVGVGGEADSGVEGEVRRDGRHARRVERQHPCSRRARRRSRKPAALNSSMATV